MSKSSKLTALIVSYNSADVLPQLLDSLWEERLEGTHLDILLVDNASSDGSVVLAAAHIAAPRIIHMGRNAGYAAAINAGLAEIPSNHPVLLLNPDIRLRPGAINTMMIALKDSVGIVVPRLIDPDGHLHHSIRTEPSLLTAWSEALLGGDRAARMGLGEIITNKKRYEQRGLVQWASGAALLISANARRRVGPWNESYFLYSEEVEFMQRVRAKALHILYEPSSVAVHVGGESNRDPALFSLMTLNRIRYYRERHGAFAAMLFQLAIAAGMALRLRKGQIYGPALRAALTLSLGRFRSRFPELSL
jgi:N-acetylglucosaminyl-diphospho-decaprenol L-rhamnosyltransferase